MKYFGSAGKSGIGKGIEYGIESQGVANTVMMWLSGEFLNIPAMICRGIWLTPKGTCNLYWSVCLIYSLAYLQRTGIFYGASNYAGFAGGRWILQALLKSTDS